MAVLRRLSQRILINNNWVDNKLHMNNINTCGIFIRQLSYSSIEYDDSKNPAPIFIDQTVQSLLRNLTRVDLTKVFRKRKLGTKRLADPVYKFMTDEELQQAMEEAHKKANKLLQIPPVVPVHKPRNRVFSKEPLEGLETCRMVFTDITFGVKNNDRLIVVREPDGTLQDAEWELRDRMNQLYFPTKGKFYKPPKMFENEYFETLLNKQEYEFILDCACIQFEPNDSEYQRVTSITYQHINDNNGFDLLRSTRHFGALTFFLVWNKNIDNLLLDLIETLHIEEANCLIKLYSKVHNVEINSNSNMEAVEDYIENYCNKKPALQLAVQAYKDLVKQKEELERGIQVAHGIS